jgi:hypothetical protein
MVFFENFYQKERPERLTHGQTVSHYAVWGRQAVGERFADCKGSWLFFFFWWYLDLKSGPHAKRLALATAGVV